MNTDTTSAMKEDVTEHLRVSGIILRAGDTAVNQTKAPALLVLVF